MMTRCEKLDAVNNSIVGELSESFVSLRVFTDEVPFISFWHQSPPPSKRQATSIITNLKMRYLPLFYVIACLDEEDKLCLKLITFHGKLVDEINESQDGLILKEDMLTFVKKLSYLHLCRGVQLPDFQSKFDLSTMSSLYLLEHLEENVIIRSAQCSFALCPEDLVCKACAAFSGTEKGEEIRSLALPDYVSYCDTSNDIHEKSELLKPPNDQLEIVSIQIESNMLEVPNDLEETKSLIIYTDDSEMNLEPTKRSIPSIPIQAQLEPCDTKKTETETKEKDPTLITSSASRSITKGSKNLKLRKPHKCPHCDHTTRKKQHLKDHILAVHEKARPFTCEHCSYSATTNSTIIKHIKIVHEKILTILCDKCDYKTSTNQNLLRHVNTVHEKMKPFRCEKCPHATTTQRDLDAHVMAKHDKLKPIQCDQCDYTTCRKSSLNFHIKRVHDPTFKPEMCDKCEFVANSRGNLLRHMRTVHDKIKPFQCDHCQFATGTKQTLENHVRIKHDKIPKSFMCQHCSHSTASKGNLDIHIALAHSTVKPFKCKECSFETALKSHLKRHVTTVHEKIKPYQCQLCPYASQGKLQLQDHIRAIHEQVKGFFKCKWCNVDFNTRKARRRHVQELHPDVTVVKGEYDDC